MRDLADRAPTARLRRAFTTRPGLVSAAAFVLVAMMVVPLTALGYPRLSVFDEATHLDQALRLAHGDLVVRGDTLLPEVLRDWACRGFYDPTATFPACGDESLDPAAFPAAGLQYNWFHAPGYYLLTGVAARVTTALTPIDSVLTAARLMGVAWLAGAMAVTAALARRLGSSRSAANAAAVGLATVPTVVHLAGIVNNDIAAALAGGLVVLVAVTVVQRNAEVPRPWLWLAGVGVLAGLTKLVVFPAVIAGAVLVLAGPWVSRRRAGGDALPAEPGARTRMWAAAAVLAATLVLAFAATQGGWWAVQTMRADDRPYTDPLPGNLARADVTVRAIAATANDTWPPSGQPFIAEHARTPALDRWQQVVDAALVAVPFALVAFGIADHRRRRNGTGPLGAALAIATVVGLAVGSVALNVQHLIAKGSAYQSFHPRYGLALLPALLAGGALVADRHRYGRRALWLAVGVGGVVVVGSHLI
jgi:hypothetical protein